MGALRYSATLARPAMRGKTNGDAPQALLKHVGSAHVGAVLRVKLRSGRAPGRSGLFFGAGAAGRQATKSKIYDDAGGNLINRIYTTFE